MPRNDDIGDLPSLMPDSDEIKGTRKQSSSASVGGNTNLAGGNANNEGADGSSRRGGRDSGRPIASPRAMQPSSPQIVAKNNGILWVLVVTMFFGVLGGGYWSYNKLTDVDLLLMVSRGELDHARKRIGELEALVVATDVNSNKSGTVVQAQVRLVDNRAKERNKFVDTEIDKLWGVAYRNNRPAIEENQKAIDNNTATVKQHQEKLKTQNEKVSLQRSAIAKQKVQIQEASQNGQLVVQQVEDQLNKLQLLQDKLSGVLKRVASQDKTLSDQHKTDIGQAQLAQQHAKDLAAQDETLSEQREANLSQALRQQQYARELTALTASVETLLQQIEGSTTDDDLDIITNRIGILESKARVLTAIEQNASEMDERVYLMEQSAESVRAFRRDTNRLLNELQSQIRNLAYSQ
jgi:chromosome segregation ATPase|tara:strand:- start:2731 stop:3954 length:1224 start_codon:yes stop_codon:yes gene_type:complete